jgi:hypothetical protein
MSKVYIKQKPPNYKGSFQFNNLNTKYAILNTFTSLIQFPSTSHLNIHQL